MDEQVTPNSNVDKKYNNIHVPLLSSAVYVHPVTGSERWSKKRKTVSFLAAMTMNDHIHTVTVYASSTQCADVPEDPMAAMLAKIRSGEVHLKKVSSVSQLWQPLAYGK